MDGVNAKNRVNAHAASIVLKERAREKGELGKWALRRWGTAILICGKVYKTNHCFVNPVVPGQKLRCW